MPVARLGWSRESGFVGGVDGPVCACSAGRAGFVAPDGGAGSVGGVGGAASAGPAGGAASAGPAGGAGFVAPDGGAGSVGGVGGAASAGPAGGAAFVGPDGGAASAGPDGHARPAGPCPDPDRDAISAGPAARGAVATVRDDSFGINRRDRPGRIDRAPRVGWDSDGPVGKGPTQGRGMSRP